MLFNSPDFALFLPMVFCLYWSARRNMRIQNLLVVAASCVFYGWWDWRFLGLIAFTAFWSYMSGLVELKRWTEKPSRMLLVCSLAVNLGVLGYFKYCNFFMEQAADLLRAFGFDPHLPALEPVLTLRISQ